MNNYQINRQKLLESSEVDAYIIFGYGVLQRANDTSFAFRQESSMLYLTGLNEPDIDLCVFEDKSILLVTKRNDIKSIFDGSVDHDLLKKISGVDEIIYHDQLDTLIKKLNKFSRVGIIKPGSAVEETYGVYSNPRPLIQWNQWQRNLKTEIIDLNSQISLLRSVKQDYEIANIEQAIKITCDTISEISKNKQHYKYEYEYEAAITAGIRSRGASGHAYEPIVAGGNRATTLHYIQNNQLIRSNEGVLIDVGAEYEGYAADITRTISPNIKKKSRLNDVISAVNEVQSYAMSLLRSGVMLREYGLSVEVEMGKQLKKLKLIKNGTTEEIRKYFPHSVSHFLGLDVHDVGDYRIPLVENMILTVEPGIYIPEEGIGVRIEDDVLITKTGMKNLSSGLPSLL